MPRAIILVLDSFGIGASQDASHYGDVGANTLRHIAEHCAKGLADREGLRQGMLKIPHLLQQGLGLAAMASANETIPELVTTQTIHGLYGYAQEQSCGKDTPSGHWEMAGVPVLFEWGYFPPNYPSFPEALVSAFIKEAKIPGILGNCHASGTKIIDELGTEHIKTGRPIVYTSGDSVFQIACHEIYFGLDRLYEICAIARRLVDDYNIGRVIARPFVGVPGHFKRTANRRDIPVPPPELTLLDNLLQSGREVIAIGKVGDIFARRGVSETLKGENNDKLFDITLQAIRRATDGALIFANFVDFDTLYGHRRDVAGYAAALEAFDARLPELYAVLQPGDLVIITADHGCDPTAPGSDHTREYIPVLAFGPSIRTEDIGLRSTFADIGQTVAKHLGSKPLDHGTSFL